MVVSSPTGGSSGGAVALAPEILMERIHSSAGIRMEDNMDIRISPATLDLEVTGPGIASGSLGATVAGGPTLLVFLRHFG